MNRSIWIVVHGEAYVPEAFDTKEDAEMFIELDDEGRVISGPWEVYVDGEAMTRYDPGEQGRRVMEALKLAEEEGEDDTT